MLLHENSMALSSHFAPEYESSDVDNDLDRELDMELDDLATPSARRKMHVYKSPSSSGYK